MNAGIYLITVDVGTPKHYYYVGQTSNFKRRKWEHLNSLANGTHANRFIQNVYNKYGAETLVIELLESCQPDELNDREQWWITEMFGYDNCMNISPSASSNRGYKKTDEARQQQSLRQIGEKNPCWGRIATTEERERRAFESSGEKNSFYGKRHNDEAKKKMSLNAAAKRPAVAEKIAAALRGRKLPESLKLKLRTAHKTKAVVGKAEDVVLRFDSIAEAKRAGFHATHIAECCEGKRKSHKGYRWEYADPQGSKKDNTEQS